MRRIGVFVATATAAAVLFLTFSMFTAKEGKAVYLRRTAHFSATIPLASAPVTIFTVPANGSDLTITDIVYEFRLDPEETSTEGTRQGYHARLRLVDGGPGVNPTMFNTSTLDTAIFTFVTDRFQVKQSTGAVDALTTIAPLNPDMDSLDYTTCWNGTESHHFQTGLVVPSGNIVQGRVEVWGLGSPLAVPPPPNSNVEVHITGILE